MTDELSQAMGVPPGSAVDRWINVRWNAPANMALFAGAVAAGRPQSEGRETPTSHLFTPETATTSHYWFGISFPKTMGELGARMAEEQINYLKHPFQTEDLPMLEAQQKNMGDQDLMALKPVWLPGDAAGARARGILRRMIAQEKTGDTPETTRPD